MFEGSALSLCDRGTLFALHLLHSAGLVVVDPLGDKFFRVGIEDVKGRHFDTHRIPQRLDSRKLSAVCAGDHHFQDRGAGHVNFGNYFNVQVRKSVTDGLIKPANSFNTFERVPSGMTS